MLRNISIAPKLIGAFLSIALIVALIGYISLHISERSLEKTLGESSQSVATAIMENVDRELALRINDMRALSSSFFVVEAASASNSVFEELPDRTAYIDEQEAAWVASGATGTPLMASLLERNLSHTLRQKIAIDAESAGYPVFSEIFLTNKHGATIALSERTSDYRQDDEEWWQMARDGGLAIHGIHYDESADTYSVDISMRVSGTDGRFAGVLKGVLNIQGVMAVMQESASITKHETVVVRLIDKENRMIFDSSGEFAFLEDVSDTNFVQAAAAVQSGYSFEYGRFGDADSFFAFARSSGYRAFPGLGWLSILAYDQNEILSPVAQLRVTLIFLVLFTVLVAVGIGIILARAISRPITGAKNAAVEIARGNMNVRIDTSGKDEVAVLMRALERMRISLKTVMEEYEKKIKL